MNGCGLISSHSPQIIGTVVAIAMSLIVVVAFRSSVRPPRRDSRNNPTNSSSSPKTQQEQTQNNGNSTNHSSTDDSTTMPILQPSTTTTSSITNQLFEQTATKVRTTTVLTDMEKLFLYGLYKQATEGNVPTASSMMLWNPVARAKHQAWSKFKDTSRDQAKMMYVHAFATMIGDHSSTATAPTGAAATLREQSTYDAMEDMEDDMDVFGNGMGVRPSMPTGEEDDSDSDSDSEKDDDDRSQPLHHHPLHSVARRGDAEQLRQLLASSQGSSDHNNSHIDECDKSGQTALHLAADQGNDECVQLLLQAGANPNAADLDGITVLQTAVIADHVSTAALLLQAGANADQTDADGETPRSCANEGSTPEMKLLFATYITD